MRLILTLFLIIGATLCAQPINLAKFQKTLSSSNGDSTSQNEATDGVVSNQSRWYTSTSGPHWLEIQLTESFTLGSAHLYLGKDDGLTISNFTLQYANGSGWQTIRTYSGNNATDINCIFPTPVLANKFRLYVPSDTARVKEIALFAPNAGQGYPLGTDVIISLGRDRPISGSSTNSSNYPYKAIDGYVDDNSRYLSANNEGPHTLTIDMGSLQKTGGFHLYTGYNSGSALAEFTVHTHDGDSWSSPQLHSVSSGTITNPNRVVGNTSQTLTVLFPPGGIETQKVQVKFYVPYGRIREFVVFPANKLEDGSHGYPIGAGVKAQARPSTNFKDYHDAWHRIQNRFDNYALLSEQSGSTQVQPGESIDNEHKLYQLLYLRHFDAYRIRAKDSGKCLEVKDASTSPGAAIVESNNYSAAPHQLWKLQKTDSNYFRLVNYWSGLALHTNGLEPAVVTQQPITSADHVQWKTSNTEYYFRKGTGGWVGSFGTSWGYDWARNDKDGLSESKFYAPMQHRQGWPNLGTLHKKRHDWNNDHKINVLLGFNEPDRPDQANMGVDKAVELWPRLMDLDIPLVSPACSLGGESWWLSSWNNKISNKGYRCEYAGAHWYSGPSSTNLLNYIDTVQSAAGGKPVWLTEFSVVDWSNGNGDWSEETNYNFILEFLWRAEAKNNLRKYAIFIFSGGAPTNPWDKTNPRSNFRKNDGSLHPFGKAYAAWDGDKTIRTQQPYLIHNRNARHRIRNSGSGNPTPSWIRREDDSVQWYLEEAGTDKVYLTSIVDNTRLRYSGGTLDFAPALTTGPEVEWTYNKEQYGWHNIIHPQTGQYLRLHRENNASNAPTSQEFQMVSAAAASGYSSTDWWFVKPHNPSTITSPDPNGSYEAWALSHGLPTSTPDADPDLDGLTNLAEHAFLTDPNKKTPSVLTINQDDHLSFRLNTANPNLTWSLQTSTDLGDNDPWTSVPYTVESSDPQPYGSTLMTLSPNSISPPQYFRLEISLAP